MQRRSDAEDDDDWDGGDITDLLNADPDDMEESFDKVGREMEADTVLGMGLGMSEQLGVAVEEAVQGASASIPHTSVPALAVVFFSASYSDQGYGRVLPVLLKEFALYGGKAWKDGITVVGCSVRGFDGHGSDPGVRVVLLQADGLRVVPFCVADEAASWTEGDWQYKGGLKGLIDDPSVTMMLFGHPSSRASFETALGALQASYPSAKKVGGVAGSLANEDSCLIFKKGSGVFNKRGQLIHGEDKDAAKYSSSDDIFFDGGSWRRSGIVGVVIEDLCADVAVSQGATPASPEYMVTATDESETLCRTVKPLVASEGAEQEAAEALGAKGEGLLVGVGTMSVAERAGIPDEEADVVFEAEQEGGGLRLKHGRVRTGDTVRRYEAMASDAAQKIGRMAAAKAVRKEEGMLAAGGLMLSGGLDAESDAASEAGKQLVEQFQQSIGASVSSAILDTVLGSLPNFALLDSKAQLLPKASSFCTIYGSSQAPAKGLSLEDEVEEMERYSDTIIGADGRVLTIPTYVDPQAAKKRKKR